MLQESKFLQTLLPHLIGISLPNQPLSTRTDISHKTTIDPLIQQKPLLPNVKPVVAPSRKEYKNKTDSANGLN